MHPKIVLATLNARYSHASFGLRYLLANLGEWRAAAVLREFTINQPRMEIVEQLLADDPEILGFGVYIWNVIETTEVIAHLRLLKPSLKIIIGGPEVSYEYEGTEIFALADHLIPGEADVAFRELISALAAGQTPPKVVSAALPEPAAIEMPYREYTDEDLKNRLIYVEASRGCPFSCEFCLSSLDIPVRAFPLEPFLQELQILLDRGARAFKFVDRTFNLNVKSSLSIINFCLDRFRPGFELHFEMIPDRLPLELREVIGRFPAGAVQFEVGVQSLTPGVTERISRKQNVAKLEENFRFLREHTGIHVHADLIFGLPGETLETFGDSFNRLLAMQPGEIQMGILKRLRGTPISRHTVEFEMVYSPRPPYEIMQSKLVPFPVMQRMKRFARYFELYHNSGNFEESLRHLFFGGAGHAEPFQAFLAFSDWLYAHTAQTHQFGLPRLYQLLMTFLTEEQGKEPASIAQAMLRDYDRKQIRKERLEFLRPYVPAGPLVAAAQA